MKTEALFNAQEFFKLPEALFDEAGITPLESRNQPTGFMDIEERKWIAILTDDGLKRKRLD